MHFDVLIVGAGHAGAQAAISLRQSGFGGTIGMIGDEAEPPYERPPLSKDYLSKEKTFERILIRPREFWTDRNIDLLLGRRVHAVDPSAKCVTANDRKISYGKLIWATGGSPRTLSLVGADASNVHYVRRRADVDAIMVALDHVRHVTIIGGGYIGLEAAAVLSKLGKQVVLLEALDRVLARVAGPALSRFFEEEHRAHGVDLRLGARIDHLVSSGGVVSAVRMANGDDIRTDMVIAGIGILPETQPLLDAGCIGLNGIDVDAFCRTSEPDIYAIGDCAAHANRFADGATIRLESVQNANDQAKIAVGHILGTGEAYDAVPWFWSNQYDLKLQTVGLSTGYDETILRGDPADRRFSILYLKEGRLIAADCVNAVKDYAQARAHVVARARLDPILLADTATPLKSITESEACA